jgi:hypothetical protein
MIAEPDAGDRENPPRHQQPARPGSPSYGYQGDPPQPPEAGFSHDYEGEPSEPYNCIDRSGGGNDMFTWINQQFLTILSPQEMVCSPDHSTTSGDHRKSV